MTTGLHPIHMHLLPVNSSFTLWTAFLFCFLSATVSLIYSGFIIYLYTNNDGYYNHLARKHWKKKLQVFKIAEAKLFSSCWYETSTPFAGVFKKWKANKGKQTNKWKSQCWKRLRKPIHLLGRRCITDCNKVESSYATVNPRSCRSVELFMVSFILILSYLCLTLYYSAHLNVTWCVSWAY